MNPSLGATYAIPGIGPPLQVVPGASRSFNDRQHYLWVGMANSEPPWMESDQRCMIDFCLV
ncbi:hypothetical protein GCM10017767_08400 [Halomonas urumqiensis]|nr:hypothetical protein GCM10017767_08400 [Halomonas urumqiensis]